MKHVWLVAAFLLLMRAAPAGAVGNDPVIATDPKSGGVVTQSMVQRMVEEDRRAASLFGIAPPGPQIAAEITEALKTGFMHYDAGLRVPYALPWLAIKTQKSRQQFIDTMRAQIMSAANDGYRYLSFAAVLSGLGERGIRDGVTISSAGPGGPGSGMGPGGPGAMIPGLLLQQTMQQNALMGAIRSTSPRCNVYTGAIASNLPFCHP